MDLLLFWVEFIFKHIGNCYVVDRERDEVTLMLIH